MAALLSDPFDGQRGFLAYDAAVAGNMLRASQNKCLLAELRSYSEAVCVHTCLSPLLQCALAGKQTSLPWTRIKAPSLVQGALWLPLWSPLGSLQRAPQSPYKHVQGFVLGALSSASSVRAVKLPHLPRIKHASHPCAFQRGYSRKKSTGKVRPHLL